MINAVQTRKTWSEFKIHVAQRIKVLICKTLKRRKLITSLLLCLHRASEPQTFDHIIGQQPTNLR